MENTLDKRRGLAWNLTTVQDDLDYTDDIALLASRHSGMQEKISHLLNTAATMELNVPQLQKERPHTAETEQRLVLARNAFPILHYPY